MLPKLTVLCVKISCTAASVEMIFVVVDRAVRCYRQAFSFSFTLQAVVPIGAEQFIFSPVTCFMIYITWYIIIVDILQHTEQVGTINIASELYLELSGSHLGRDTSCPDMFLWFPSVPPVKCQSSTLGLDHVLLEPVHHESLIPLWMM